MKTTFRSLFACAAAGALAVSLAACGPDDDQGSASTQLALADGLAPGWSMMDLAGVDPAIYGDDDGPLPRALPMAASYDGGDQGYAPMYDYAPDDGDSYYEPLDDSYYYDDDGYDDGYYDEPYDAGYSDGGLLGLGGDGNGLALLAVATALSGVLGDAPPDYGFGYDGVSPWAWETGDRYYRYAEPVHGGYRYYYYEPDAYRPFFVSDPYYSYGYRDDRLVAVYDRGGRRIDARRARLQLQAAKAYYARAERLNRAAQHDRHGVSAPLWARQRETIARDRNDWVQKASRRPAVQQWEARNAPKVQQHWASEALVRRDAEKRFANWQRADYRTPAPKFYTPEVRQEQVRKIADLRQDHAKELADRRRERAETQHEVRQEAQQRIAQRTEWAAPRGQQQAAVREQVERQRAARQPGRDDRTRADDTRAAVTAPANRMAERVAARPQPARAAIAAQREDRKAAQAQRAANRAVNDRKVEAAKAERHAAPAKPVARQTVTRPTAAAERPAREARVERQQQLQQRQKAQQEATAERARQIAARQQERAARQQPARANVERQQESASRQAAANSARQAAAARREAQAGQRQAQAEQRQRAQAAERQQTQTAQRQRAQAEQRQAQVQQRQQARGEQREQARQERQNAREEQRNKRRGDRG